jgi:hypothetical protein
MLFLFWVCVWDWEEFSLLGSEGSSTTLCEHFVSKCLTLAFSPLSHTRIIQKFKAHDKGPTIACVWHPLEPSVVFTCGWDGVIKMWQ